MRWWPPDFDELPWMLLDPTFWLELTWSAWQSALEELAP